MQAETRRLEWLPCLHRWGNVLLGFFGVLCTMLCTAIHCAAGCGSGRGSQPVKRWRYTHFLLVLLLLEVQAEGLALPRSQLSTVRVGKPSNPGPVELIQVGTSNPSGLRGKEACLMDLGPGIWALSETQLSAQSFHASKHALVRQGKEAGRTIKVLSGAPAPLRSNSSWAGAWTGVLTLSDWQCRSLLVPWPNGHFQTGRVQLTQHIVGGFPLVHANVYGFASGNTHLAARQSTDALLTAITLEVVLGRTGPRIVTGDLNHHPSTLAEIDVWRSLGWKEVQELAQERWGQPVQPTYKGATVRDFIFVSPEAAAMLHEVSVGDIFSEHSLVTATLAMPVTALPRSVWPLPSEC